MIEVRPRLFVGSWEDASDSELLASRSITHVLSVTLRAPDFSGPNGLRRPQSLLVPLYDEENAKLLEELPRCVRFITTALASDLSESGHQTGEYPRDVTCSGRDDDGSEKSADQKEKGPIVRSRGAVLLHCQAGISRSCSVTVAYLMHTEGLSVQQALDSLRLVHPGASPNPGFIRQLELYHSMGLRIDPSNSDYKALKLRQQVQSMVSSQRFSRTVNLNSFSQAHFHPRTTKSAVKISTEGTETLLAADLSSKGTSTPAPSRNRRESAGEGEERKGKGTFKSAGQGGGLARHTCHSRQSDQGNPAALLSVPGGSSEKFPLRVIPQTAQGIMGVPEAVLRCKRCGVVVGSSSNVLPHDPPPCSDCEALGMSELGIREDPVQGPAGVKGIEAAEQLKETSSSRPAMEAQATQTVALGSVQHTAEQLDASSAEAGTHVLPCSPAAHPQGTVSSPESSPAHDVQGTGTAKGCPLEGYGVPLVKTGKEEQKCGKCRVALEQKGLTVPSSSSLEHKCSGIFVEPMKWMASEVHSGKVEGKLCCFKCSSRLGSFNWAGVHCGCGTWVVPAFQLHRKSVEATLR